MLDMGLEDEQIDPEEHEIINKVLEANDSCAKDIMVPRSNVVGITDEYTYDQVMETFRSEKYSRLVVLDKDKDKVLGVLYVKDMLFVEPSEFNMHKMLRHPYFTFETKKTQDILTDLRNTSNSMAIVLDEYGGLAGILTIEDIIEEFVGQIRDEYDDDELKQIKKVDDNTYEVDSSINLSDLNDALDLNLQSENYNSIGGYIIETMDELPQPGDIIQADGVQLEVLEVVDNKTEKIRIKIESIMQKKNLEK
jgi:CBS domain containing-hemolysin-like protein